MLHHRSLGECSCSGRVHQAFQSPTYQSSRPTRGRRLGMRHGSRQPSTAAAAAAVEFAKYQGLGNDFILVRAAVKRSRRHTDRLCCRQSGGGLCDSLRGWGEWS